MAIYHETVLKVADNTGALLAQCIGFLGGCLRTDAKIGDIIKVVVKDAIPTAKAPKSQIYNAVIVRTRQKIRRKDGTYCFFEDNAVVLLQNNGEMLGTRVFGPVARELKKSSFLKILSLAEEVR